MLTREATAAAADADAEKKWEVKWFNDFKCFVCLSKSSAKSGGIRLYGTLQTISQSLLDKNAHKCRVSALLLLPETICAWSISTKSL